LVRTIHKLESASGFLKALTPDSLSGKAKEGEYMPLISSHPLSNLLERGQGGECKKLPEISSIRVFHKAS